jgi:death on curing protein
MVRFLPRAVVLAINEDQARKYGGQPGVRDQAALASALHMPRAEFDGQWLHDDLCAMAAAYGYHLSQNHPFVDGNKRTAGMAMFAFLVLNDAEPVAPEDEYYATMMAVASGAMTKAQLADWLRAVALRVPPDAIT